MKKSLYNISKEMQEIASQLEEDELTPELENALIISQNEFQVKGIEMGYVIKERENNILAAERELKKVQDYIRREKNVMNRVKEAISNAMQLHGIEKVSSPTLNLSFRKSESVEVDNISQLEPRFLTEKVTVSPDKTRIKEAIKQGENVEGARISVNYNLQIK